MSTEAVTSGKRTQQLLFEDVAQRIVDLCCGRVPSHPRGLPQKDKKPKKKRKPKGELCPTQNRKRSR